VMGNKMANRVILLADSNGVCFMVVDELVFEI
jgi:hypothetical protein